MNAYAEGAIYLPGGANELPGFDPYWETYPVYLPVTVASAENIMELRCGVSPGESLQFEVLLMLGSDAGSSCALVVQTPDNPNGGFHHAGNDETGTWQTNAYGADSFSAAVGSLGCGISGTLLGYDTHYITGLLANGRTPGFLGIRIASASGVIVKPGSYLRVRRMHDSRTNQVGA